MQNFTCGNYHFEHLLSSAKKTQNVKNMGNKKPINLRQVKNCATGKEFENYFKKLIKRLFENYHLHTWNHLDKMINIRKYRFEEMYRLCWGGITQY